MKRDDMIGITGLTFSFPSFTWEKQTYRLPRRVEVRCFNRDGRFFVAIEEFDILLDIRPASDFEGVDMSFDAQHVLYCIAEDKPIDGDGDSIFPVGKLEELRALISFEVRGGTQ